MLLSDDDQDGERAAICSSLCTTLFDGLEVMHHGIQDRERESRSLSLTVPVRGTNFKGTVNFTRFFVLANSLDVTPPLLPREPRLRRALVRVSKGSSETQSESITSKRPLHLAISTLLTTFGVPVIRVDRRPSIGGIPFDDVYFVEVDELGMLPEPGDDTNRRAEDGRWMRIVEKGVQRLRVAGLQGAIIGIW